MPIHSLGSRLHEAPSPSGSLKRSADFSERLLRRITFGTSLIGEHRADNQPKGCDLDSNLFERSNYGIVHVVPPRRGEHYRVRSHRPPWKVATDDGSNVARNEAN